MFEKSAVKEKIHELYPDIAKYGIELSVAKDRLVGAESYELTLEKDKRKARFKIGIEDVKECVAGNRCSLITAELARFIKTFIDEGYAVAEAG